MHILLFVFCGIISRVLCVCEICVGWLWFSKCLSMREVQALYSLLILVLQQTRIQGSVKIELCITHAYSIMKVECERGLTDSRLLLCQKY